MMYLCHGKCTIFLIKDSITFIYRSIMAEYIKKEMPDVHKTGTNLVYYRLKRRETLDFKEFTRRVSKANRLYTPSVIQGVIMAVSSELAYQIAQGHNVKIDGLGTFHAKLGLDKTKSRKEMDTFEEGTMKLNATSLDVTDVAYRADKELVRAADRNCQLERGGEDRLRRSKYTKEERIERAIQYLHRESFMHVRDYAALNDMSYAGAYNELKGDLVGSATITSRGSKSARIYFLKPETRE